MDDSMSDSLRERKRPRDDSEPVDDEDASKCSRNPTAVSRPHYSQLLRLERDAGWAAHQP